MRFPSFSNLSKGFATTFHIKGVEANRAPMPQASYSGFSGGLGGDYDDVLSAIRGLSLGQNSINWAREAGDFRKNSIVSLCQNWIGTSFPEAPVRIGKLVKGKVQAVENMDDHPALKLLRRPNSRYSGKWLSWTLTGDWYPMGNAYSHIVTNGKNNLIGEPAELEFLPADFMRPVGDSTGHLSHYEYSPNGRIIEFDPREVVHHRFGIDRLNPLAGLSPLLAQTKFIVGDNSGAAYSASLLLNGGIPPALLVPEVSSTPGLGQKALDPDTAKLLTDDLAEKFKSEPGKVRFLSNAIKLLMLGYKPSEMALNELLDEPETRIPAAYGIPPEVLKLRVGMSASTENNIRESRKAAWQDCLIPCQDHFADTWTTQFLVPRFGNDTLVLFYDRSEIGVLQPDMSALRTDAANLYRYGVIDRAAAKTMIKEAVDKDKDTGHYSTGNDDPAEGQDPTDPADPAKVKPVAQKKTLVDTRIR